MKLPKITISYSKKTGALSRALSVFFIVSLAFGPVPTSTLFSDWGVGANVAEAAFNPQINYQGKLTNSSNVAVPDGAYNIEFKLYTVPTGGSPIWTETWCLGAACSGTGTDNRIQVSSGLFSTLLGSTTNFTGVDFDQTLYLGVNIGGTGSTPSWDGEMAPRKKLGAVPAAFVSQNSAKLNNLDSSQFLRSDAVNSTSTSNPFVSISQAGSGDALVVTGQSSAPVLNVQSGGNIGVGTTSPYARFSIAGAAGATRDLFAVSTSTSAFATATAFRIAADGKAHIGNTYSTSFGTGALNVYNSATPNQNAITYSAGGALLFSVKDYGYVTVRSNDTVYNASLSINTAFDSLKGIVVRANSGTQTGNLQEWQDNTGAVLGAVTPAGNLGVGSSTPGAKLGVQGNGIFSGDLSVAGLNATGTVRLGSLTGPLQAIAGVVSATSTLSPVYGGTGISTLPTYGQLLLGNASGGYTLTATSSLGLVTSSTGFLQGGNSFGATAVLGTNDSNALTFETNGSEVGRFTAGGNFGIGTTTPVARLSVNTPLATIAAIFKGTTAGAVGIGSASSVGIIQAYTNDSAVATGPLSIQPSGGNVGIGTTSPNAKLSVYSGAAGAYAVNAAADELVLENSASGGLSIVTPDASTGNIFFGSPSRQIGSQISWNHSGGLFTLGTGLSGSQVQFLAGNSVEAMRIDGSGKVGIGTTTPNAVLNVNTTLTNGTPAFRISNTSTGPVWNGLQIDSDNLVAGTARNWFVGANSVTYGDFNIQTSNAQGGSPVSSGTSRLYISSGGSVGIGTTTPVGELYIRSAVGTDSDLYIGAPSGRSALLRFAVDGINPGGVYYNYNSAAGLDFLTNGTSKVTVTSGGSVGIGTSTPQRKLSIFSSSNPVLQLTNSTAGESANDGFLLTQAGLHSYLENTEAGSMYFRTSATDRMTIDSSGNVGIGTTTPDVANVSEKLVVTGDVFINNIAFDSGMALGMLGGTPYIQGANAANNSSKSLLLQPSGGSVGIGTSTPVANLEVVGSTGIYSRNSTGGRIVFDDSDVAAASTPMSYVSGVDGTLQFGRANRNTSTGLTTGSTESLRITAQGLVGIGTTTPDRALNVNGNATFGTIAASTPTATPLNVSLGSTYGTNTPGSVNNLKWDLFTSSSTGVRYGIGMSLNLMEFQAGASGGHAFFVNNGTEAMRIQSGGNVGIGTTTPLGAFDVKSGTDKHIVLGQGGIFTTNTNVVHLDYDETNNFGSLQTRTANVAFRDFVINQFGGNLGVGTTSPGAKLGVQGNGIFSGNLGAANITATGTITTPNLTLGTLTGPLQAIAGVVSATSTLSPVYGGTGISTLPAYGQLLLGNASGGYTLTATSSLGLVTSSTGFLQGGNSFGATAVLGTNDANPLTFETAGTERARFTNGGDLGIGTSSPTAKLNVYGSASIDGSLKIRNVNDAVNGSRGIDITPNVFNGDQYITAFNNSGARLFIQTNNTGSGTTTTNIVMDPSGRYIAFGIATSTGSGNGPVERVRIDSNGRLGIGTTSPYAPLSVGGEIVGQNFTATSTVATSTFGDIRMNNTGSRVSILDWGLAGSTDSDRIYLYNGFSRYGLGIKSGNIDLFSGSGGGFAFRVNASASNAMVLNSFGNLGVGTSTPVGSGITVSAASTPQITFADQSIAGSNKNFHLRINPSVGTGVFQINPAAPDGSASTLGLSIDRSGEVGIGTTSPLGLLQLSGSGAVPQLIISGTGAGADMKDWRFVANSNSLFLGTLSEGTTASGDTAITIGRETNSNDVDYVELATNNEANRLRYTNAGFLGIGTTSPTALLTFPQSTGDRIHLYSSGNVRYGLGIQANEMRLFVPNGGNNMTFGSLSTSDGTTYTERVRFTDAGLVGIGTSSPVSKLTVGGGDILLDNTYGLRIKDASGTARTVISLSAADNVTIAGNGSSSDVSLVAASTFIVKSNGTVGVGTTTPTARFAVNGNILGSYFVATSTTASVLPYASTTALTVSGVNGLTLGTLTGPLQAIAGVVSATSTLSPVYGGTGISTLPAYGQLLLGNASGGYTLTATSSLGLVTSSTGFLQGGNSFGATAVLGTNDSNALTFETNGSEVARMTTTAKFGLGTTSPDFKFAIDNGSNASTLELVSSADNYLRMRSTAVSGRAWTLVSASDGSFNLWDPAAGNRLVVNSAGNIGLGTSSPDQKLVVNGAARIMGSESAYTGGAGLELTYTGGTSYMTSYDRTNSVYRPMIIRGATTTIQSNGTSAITVINGNVGIGTTSPGYTLDVNSTAVARANIFVGNGNNARGVFFNSPESGLYTYGIFRTATGDVGIRSNSGSVDTVTVASTSNVGIGTSSPYARLSVAGNAVFDADVRSSFFTATSSAATSTFAGAVQIAGASGLTVSQNGNASLGATVGGYKLRIQDTDVASNGSLNSHFSPTFTGNNSTIFNPNNLSANYNLAGFDATGQTNGASISSTLSGNGTTSAVAGLYVQTGPTAGQTNAVYTAGITSNLLNSGTGTSTSAYGFRSQQTQSTGVFANVYGYRADDMNASTTAVGFFSAMNSGAGKFAYYGSGSAVSYFGGGVGIGTTSPASGLAVYGSGQTTTALNTDGNLGGAIKVIDSGTAAGNGGAIMFGLLNSGIGKSFAAIKGVGTNGSANSAGDLAFSLRANASDATLTERVRVTAGGNVGIGTSSPYAALSVVGASGIVAEVINATSTVATSTIAGSLNVGSQTNYGVYAPTNYGLTVYGDINLWGGARTIRGSNDFLNDGGINIIGGLNSFSGTGGPVSVRGGSTGGLSSAGSLSLFAGAYTGASFGGPGSVNIMGGNSSGSLGTGGLVFIDGGIRSGVSANVIIASTTGNLGVGSSTPGAKLGVQGNALVSGDLSVAGLNATGTVRLGSLTGPLQTIAGVVSATSTLSPVYGGTGISTLPTYGQLLLGNASGGYTLTATSSLGLVTSSTGFLQGGNSFGATAVLGTNDSNALTFETNGSEVGRFTTGGNFGIGTTSPYNTLSVNGGITAKATAGSVIGVLVEGTTGVNFGNGGFQVKSSTGNSDWIFASADSITQIGGQPGFIFYDAENGKYPFILQQNAPDNSFVVRNTGFVGLGTSSPSQVLSVEGGGYFDGKLGVGASTGETLSVRALSGTTTIAAYSATSNTTNSTLYLGEDGSSGGGLYYDAANNVMSIFAGTGSNGGASPYGNQRITVARDANYVGIGTTNPSALLHLYESSGNTIQKIENAGASTAAISYINSSRTWQAGVASGGGSADFNVYDSTAGRKRLIIDSVGNVGIGSTSPSAKLSVQAFSTETNRMLFAIASSTAAATTTLFVVNNDGNVGIGTTSPRGTLHIANDGDAITPALVIGTDNADTRGAGLFFDDINNALVFTMNGTNNYWGMGYDYFKTGWGVGGALATGVNGGPTETSPTVLPNQTDLNTGIGQIGNDTMTLITGGSGVLRISSASTSVTTGNFGIGTTTPSSKLTITQTAGEDSLYIEDSAGDQSPFRIDQNGRMFINASSTLATTTRFGDVPEVSIFAANNTGSTVGGMLLLGTSGNRKVSLIGNQLQVDFTNSGGPSGLNLMPTVSQLAGVGIGTTTNSWPAYLTVQGTTTLATQATFATFNSAGTRTFTVQDDGSVGIGTSTPSSLFEISSATPVLTISNTNTSVSTGSTYGDLNFYSSDLSRQGIMARIRAKTNDQNVGGDGELSFWTFPGGGSLTESMRLNSAGRLGLGTTTPSAFLHVTNTSASPSFLVEDSASVDSTPFIIDASGNVGVGTSTPGLAKTIIESSGNTLSVLGISNTSNTANSRTYLNFYDNTAENSAAIGSVREASATDYGLIFRTGSGASSNGPTDRMYINAAGNVGIGTTSPARALSLEGAGGSVMRIQRNDSTNANGMIEFTGNDGGIDGSISYNNRVGSALTFETGGPTNTRMTIDANGNVGIGTTSPSGKFAVTYDTGASDRRELSVVNGRGMINRYDDNSTANTRLQNFASFASSTFGVAMEFDLSANVAGAITQQNAGYMRMIRTQDWSDTSTTNTSAMTFATRNGASGVAERMRILPNGSLAIGTTTTNVPGLHVKNTNSNGDVALWLQNNDTNSASSATLNFTVTSNDSYQGAFIRSVRSPTNDLLFGTNAAEGFRLTGNNRLMFGTTTDSYSAKLMITGGTQSDVGAFEVTPGASGSNRTLRIVSNDISVMTTNTRGQNTSTDLFLQSASSAGEVAIGTTTSPVAKLTVAAPTGVVGMVVDGGGSGVDIAQFNRNIGSNVSVAISGGGGLPQVKFGTTAGYVNSIFYDQNSGTLRIATSTTNVVAGAEPIIIKNSTGFVGIGTSSPSDKLHVEGDIRVGTGTTGCVKDADGTTIAGTCSSDENLKKNITDIGKTIDKIAGLDIVNYNWRSDEFPQYHFGSSTQIGVIAQNVETQFPQLVSTDQYGYKQVNYSALPLLAIQAVKDFVNVIDVRNATSVSPTLTVTADGKIGLGTTSPNYKLHVIGDAAATAFVNISTKESKKDIAYVSSGEKDDMLTKLRSLKLARYHYKQESDNNPMRIGLIAEESPAEVLSVDGKGVDLYKLSSLVLAGVQIQDERLTLVEKRVTDLQAQIVALQGVASTTVSIDPTTIALNSASIDSYLGNLGIKMTTTLAQFKSVVADTFTAKQVKVEEGITIKDRSNGNYYCVTVENGEMKSVSGDCAIVLGAPSQGVNQAAQVPPVPTVPSPDTEGTVTTATTTESTGGGSDVATTTATTTTTGDGAGFVETIIENGTTSTTTAPTPEAIENATSTPANP